MANAIHSSSRGNQKPRFGAKALAFVLAAAKLENPMAEMAMLRLKSGGLSEKQRIKTLSVLEKSGTPGQVRMLLEAKSEGTIALPKGQAIYREAAMTEAITNETEEALARRVLNATDKYVRKNTRKRYFALAVHLVTCASLFTSMGLIFTNTAGIVVQMVVLSLSTILATANISLVAKMHRTRDQLDALFKMDRTGLGGRSIKLLQEADAMHIRHLRGAAPEETDFESDFPVNSLPPKKP